MLLGCCVAIVVVVVFAFRQKKTENLIHFQLDYEVARPFAGLFILNKKMATTTITTLFAAKSTFSLVSACTDTNTDTAVDSINMYELCIL